ncbi:MAG: transcriptional regulator [Rhodobacteraceae bacterium]|nr:transcriptional regulator [Paracoccaceae bacterium]
MAGNRAIFGDRPPSFVSKATLAAELDMSESTVDSYVQRGLLPRPIKRGGSVRWCWAEVVAAMNAEASGEDPFMSGVNNV